MQVETYEEHEILNQTEEEMAQARKLREELGMPNQDEAFCYREWTKEEAFIFENLLPDKCSLSKFDGPVPLRVLQVAAHAKSMGIFHSELRVRYCAEEPDPILLARRIDESEWTARWYLLARWGDVLLPLEDLLPKAIRAGAARRLQGALREKAELESKIAALSSGDLNIMRAAF